MAFDIMAIDGKDLRPFPLIERKVHLAELLGRNTDMGLVPAFDDGQR